MPLVTIGIPTYRRPTSLRRAVLSALSQDHRDLEVVVSDNGSGDETEQVCRALAHADPRLTYLQQPVNRGPHDNFRAVLAAASGEYFMWLGDDDWIDPGYVSSCLRILTSSPSIAIVAGVARNYRGGAFTDETRLGDITHAIPSRRVIAYYRTIGNNAIFYGLMRRSAIASCVATNTLASDWLLMAQIAFQGQMITTPAAALHRERADTTSSSVAKMVKTLGLPRVQGILPIASIAFAAARDILDVDAVFGRASSTERKTLASAVAVILFARLGVQIRLKTFAVSVLGRERAVRWRLALAALRAGRST